METPSPYKHALRPWTDGRTRSLNWVGAAFVGVGLGAEFVSEAFQNRDEGQSAPLWAWTLLIGLSLYFLIMLAYALRTWLSSRAPDLKIQTDATSILPGKLVRGSWVFASQPHRLEGFELQIEARRYVNEDKPAKSRTAWRKVANDDKYEVLDSYAVLSLETPHDLRQGEFEFLPPQKMARTHQGTTRLVIWLLVARGRAPLWPDLHVEFVLRTPKGTVLGQKGRRKRRRPFI